MDEQFFGAQPGIPPYEEMAGDVRPDLTEKIGGTFAWVFGQQCLDDLTELTDDRAETKALRDQPPRPVDARGRAAVGTVPAICCRCTARCSPTTCSPPTWPPCRSA